ncbi:hypothetical protein ABPG75_007708 [Micractinium tetrahymenae]
MATAAVPSVGGSPASSVDSAELQSLLVELNILPAAAAAPLHQQQRAQQQGGAKRRFVLDSDSDGECSPSSSRPQASPRLDESGSRLVAAAAAALPPPRQQQQQPHRGRGPPAPPPEPEVIEILDSSSDEEDEDEEEWRIAAPATGLKMRRQVVDSDSDCEEVVLQRGAAAAGAHTALLPCFAAIPSLAAQQHAQQQQQAPPRQRSQQTAAPPAAPEASSGTASAPGRPLSASAFKRQRQELTEQLFAEFNRTVFGGRLPADLEIKWNARLLTTAGLTHYRRDIPDDPYAPPIYTARVELSSKVLDSFSKLERTLCHELCHVAAWLLDHTAKPPHGPVFRRWAEAAMARYRHLDITTCHAYEIFYPYRWQCSNRGCLQSYGRHSNSIDVTKKVCGACRAPLTFLGRFRPDGTPAKQRAASPNKYAQFVKENHAEVKAQLPAGTPQAEVMKKLSERYAALRREAGATTSSAGATDSVGATASGSGSLLSLGGSQAEGRDVTSPLRDLTASLAF